MIAKILIALAVLVVGFLIVVAFQPGTYRVERSTTVAASPALVFAQVNDLRNWQEISPYTKMDPTAKYAFSGPPAGVGAALAWKGNSKVGEGSMTITESRPGELVRMRLNFEKPFESLCYSEFTFHPIAGKAIQTSVKWSMTGEKAFVMKLMGLVVSMDKMIGPQFEEGLANLKSTVEAKTKK
ncbi:MAG TPA: SRPBCC family protein [Lacunisphaera sp.]|jgi:hypothetical protein